MVSYPELNVLAVFVGVVITNVIGTLWYSDKTPIGQFWMKEMGKTPEEIQPDMQQIGINALWSVVTTWGIAIFVGLSLADSVIDGIVIGLIAWWAFVVATSYATIAFEERNINLWLIYAGYQLVVFVILGAMFATWEA